MSLGTAPLLALNNILNIRAIGVLLYTMVLYPLDHIQLGVCRLALTNSPVMSDKPYSFSGFLYKI